MLKRFFLIALLVTGSLATPAAVHAQKAGFPRLMGMNIGAKNYDDARYQQDLARLDVVILGFYRGWQPPGYAPSPQLAMRRVLRDIKARNPAILIGQYTVLNEAYDDPKDAASTDLRDKLDAAGWWLRDAHGRKVQWTRDYATWEVNFTGWAAPDREGLRWPQWLARRNYAVFFRDVPFDIVYLDNVMTQSRVRGSWRGDGRDADAADPAMLAAHRAGHLAYWDSIRTLQPGALLIGNADNDLGNAQWRNQLNGAFLEALMGERWSIERREGWPAMMARYRGALRNTRAPKIVGFNVFGAIDDYRQFRYAYASCLLDDGYFSYTDRARGFSSVPWFDEYDHRLGAALSPPPAVPWKSGVWRRDFEHGVVLVNPGPSAATITLEAGLRRLAGAQDVAVNSGAPVSELTLASKDGIVLRR